MLCNINNNGKLRRWLSSPLLHLLLWSLPHYSHWEWEGDFSFSSLSLLTLFQAKSSKMFLTHTHTHNTLSFVCCFVWSPLHLLLLLATSNQLALKHFKYILDENTLRTLNATKYKLNETIALSPVSSCVYVSEWVSECLPKTLSHFAAHFAVCLPHLASTSQLGDNHYRKKEWSSPSSSSSNLRPTTTTTTSTAGVKEHHELVVCLYRMQREEIRSKVDEITRFFLWLWTVAY